MTLLVEVDEKGIIIKTPPIVRKFQGQHWRDLQTWMLRQGELKTVG